MAVFCAGSVNYRGVVFVDLHRFAATEVGQADVFELDAEILADDLATGEDGDILEHRLAPVAKARGLHRSHFQGAT